MRNIADNCLQLSTSTTKHKGTGDHSSQQQHHILSLLNCCYRSASHQSVIVQSVVAAGMEIGQHAWEHLQAWKELWEAQASL